MIGAAYFKLGQALQGRRTCQPRPCVGSLHSTPVATQPLDSIAKRAMSVVARRTSIPTSNRAAERSRAGCASFARKSLRSGLPSTLREIFTKTYEGRSEERRVGREGET